MKENVLDVLTYMFESYLYDEIDTLFNRESMLEELVEVGFDIMMSSMPLIGLPICQAPMKIWP